MAFLFVKRKKMALLHEDYRYFVGSPQRKENVINSPAPCTAASYFLLLIFPSFPRARGEVQGRSVYKVLGVTAKYKAYLLIFHLG